MQPFSVTVGKNSFQIATMDIFDQMIVVKRLLPIMKGFITPEVMDLVKLGADQPDKEQASQEDMKQKIMTFLPAVMDAAASLSDDGLKTIVHLCLRPVSIQQKGGMWVPLLAPNGAVMFKDVTFQDLVQLTWKVIEGHMGDFFGMAP